MPEYDYYIAASDGDGGIKLLCGPFHDKEEAEVYAETVTTADQAVYRTLGIPNPAVGYGIGRVPHGTDLPAKPAISADTARNPPG